MERKQCDQSEQAGSDDPTYWGFLDSERGWGHAAKVNLVLHSAKQRSFADAKMIFEFEVRDC
jgi:hypothetical protein